MVEVPLADFCRIPCLLPSFLSVLKLNCCSYDESESVFEDDVSDASVSVEELLDVAFARVVRQPTDVHARPTAAHTPFG